MEGSQDSDSQKESNSNLDSNSRIKELNHQLEILHLKNEMLELRLKEKESWHNERGDQISRLIREKEGIESRLNEWMLKSQSIVPEAINGQLDSKHEEWDRRSEDKAKEEIQSDSPKPFNKVIKAEILESKPSVENSHNSTEDGPIKNDEDTKLENKSETKIKKPIYSPNHSNKAKTQNSTIRLKSVPSSEDKLNKPYLNMRYVLFILVVFMISLITIVPSPIKDAILKKEVYLYQSLLPTPPSDSRVKLVLITQKDIDSLGRWPWPREFLGILHEYLSEKCEVKTIVYDILFTDNTSKESDNYLINAINSANVSNTILAAT